MLSLLTAGSAVAPPIRHIAAHGRRGCAGPLREPEPSLLHAWIPLPFGHGIR
jgi:hypothetical protein